MHQVLSLSNRRHVRLSDDRSRFLGPGGITSRQRRGERPLVLAYLRTLCAATTAVVDYG